MPSFEHKIPGWIDSYTKTFSVRSCDFKCVLVIAVAIREILTADQLCTPMLQCRVSLRANQWRTLARNGASSHPSAF